MSTAFAPKLVAPDDGRTVMLFGVRFDYKIESADSGGTVAALEVEIPRATASPSRTTGSRSSSAATT